ncbi:MAG: hypothetical protein ACE5JN_00755 [Candidatus Methylomirabilia bacterium]
MAYQGKLRGPTGHVDRARTGRYGSSMSRDEQIHALMAALLRAIESSLAATEAAREVVAELLRRGSEPGIFFRRGEPASRLDLTPRDREFLRALSIRPEER